MKSLRFLRSDITVLEPGFLTTFQDLGRVSYRSVGFPKGGAMDPVLVSLLNLLVGNDRGETVIEYCQRGPSLQFHADALLVVGAEGEVLLDGKLVSPWVRFRVRKGQVLECGHLRKGTWGYLALSGGFQVEKFFGSASTHLHLEIGGKDGRALVRGDQLPFSPYSGEAQEGVGISSDLRQYPREIRCVPGAQWDWFSQAAHQQFLQSDYTVTAESNRVGYRLKGECLMREKGFLKQELSSEGADKGTVQVSNDGQPIVLMSDAQSLGGYAKIAHVISVDQGALAQIPLGSSVKFKMVSYQEALALMKEQERELTSFKDQVSLRT